MDLPSVVQAYRDICADEFDFRLELEKLQRFAKLFRDDVRLNATVATSAPLPDLCGERVMVAEWMHGTKLLDVFRNSPPPPAPATLPEAQRQKFGSWSNLYAALHRAWSAQLFRDGEFHADGHPGNRQRRRESRRSSRRA